MKLRLLAAAVAAFALSSGAALAQSTPAKPAAPAAKPAASAAKPATTAAKPAASSAPISDKAALSYAIGYRMARDMAERNVDLDIATLNRAVQDGYAKKPPTMPVERLGAALSQFQSKMAEQEKAERAEFDKVASANKAASDAFLAANKAKPGVTVLPSGVQYRVIEPGSGAKPTASSTVSLHLRGSVSTGQEFASTYNAASGGKPAEFKVTELPLAGMKEVVQMMPVGSRWEVYMPADQAYGNDPRSPVGPGQAVVFDIKMLSSK